jgi:uncharacterized coiled-coil protein SlyX
VEVRCEELTQALAERDAEVQQLRRQVAELESRLSKHEAQTSKRKARLSDARMTDTLINIQSEGMSDVAATGGESGDSAVYVEQSEAADDSDTLQWSGKGLVLQPLDYPDEYVNPPIYEEGSEKYSDLGVAA